MTLNPKHTGTVENGKLKLDNRDFFTWDVSNFEGQDVELVIKGVRGSRSNKMNRYYWGVIIDSLVNYFNTEKTFGFVVNRNDVHDMMKAKFIGSYDLVLPDGQKVEVVKSSRDLTNGEFIEYFEAIISWSMLHLNLEIEMPNETKEAE